MTSRRLPLVVAWLLPLAALVALFGVGEGLARLAIWWRSGDPMYGAVRANLDYAPFVMTSTEPAAYSFRPRQPGVFRVLWCGSSTAWQFPREELLGAFKRALGRDVEVLNIAQPGHNSSQELVLLAVHGMQLQPDLIVTLDGLNDIVNATRTRRPGLPTIGTVIEQAIDAPTQFWVRSLFARSQLVNSALRLAERRREIAAQADTALADAVVRLYAMNVLKTSQMARGAGAHHLAILQPCSYVRKNPPAAERGLSPNVAYRHSFVAGMMRRLDEEMKATALPDNAAYLDGLTVFDDEPGVMFGDESHLTPDGRRILLERLVRELRGLAAWNLPRAVVPQASGIPQ